MPLSQVSVASGDGISTASVSGSSGALIAVDVHKVTATITPTVSAHIAASSVTIGDADQGLTGNLLVQSQSIVNNLTDGTNGSGGAVAVGVVNATVEVTDTNLAYVGDNTAIQVQGDATVRADLAHTIGSDVNVNGGGLANASESQSRVTIEYSNDVEMRTGSSITATGAVTITANTALVAELRGDADSGGAGAGSNATGYLEITDPSQTLVTLDNSRISGETTTASAVVSSMDLRGVAEAEANAAIGFTNSDATVNVYDTAKVHLKSGAWIEGTTVNLLAEHAGVDVTSRADADSNALGEARADGITDYEADSTIVVDSGATAAANVLNVDAKQTFLNYDRDVNAEAGGTTYPVEGGDLNAVRSIDYSGEMVLLMRPHAELVISTDGFVIKADGVTVNTGQGVGANVSSGPISVDPISNDNNAGTANLRANAVATFDSESAPPSTITGTGGAVRVKTTYDAITIVNNSPQAFVLNDINRATQGVQGSVAMTGDEITATFQISDSIGPTDINIVNSGSQLTVAGLIDNPLGPTTISNLGARSSTTVRPTA